LPIIGFSQDIKIAPEVKLLDANKDGIINPYEALDVLLQLQKENNKELSLKDFNAIVTGYEREQKEEFSEIFNQFDANNDKKIQFQEATDDMRDFIIAMDANQDKAVTLTEMMNFDFASAFLASEEEINERIKGLFEEYGTSPIKLSTVKKEQLDQFSEWDKNRDGLLTKKEVYGFMKANNTPVQFTVKGNIAYMTGVITSETPATVLQLLFEHPNVTTIEMITVPGSIDDVANLRASLYVHKFGLTTKLNARSSVASGGTDFFLAGKQRIVEEGAKIGVHSWGGGNVAATDLPKDDPSHQKYLDYYKIVDIPQAFYWYTLEAAPANDIHQMTEDEIKKYKIRTEK
jgi:Ca2+-binding EF-hand superfamily protein